MNTKITVAFLFFLLTSIAYAQQDSDGDGVPDSFEDVYGLTNGVDDSAIDTDGDGCNNAAEVIFDVMTNGPGTNPNIWNDSSVFPNSDFDCSNPFGSGSGGGGGGGGGSSCSDSLDFDTSYSTIIAVPSIVGTSSSSDSDRTVIFYVYVRNTNNDLYVCPLNGTVQISFNGQFYTAVPLDESGSGETSGIYTYSYIFDQNADINTAATFTIDGVASDDKAYISATASPCFSQLKELYLGYDGSYLWRTGEPNDGGQGTSESHLEDHAQFMEDGGMNDIGGSTMMNFVIKLSTGSASPANFTALGTLYGFDYYISSEINKSWSDAKTHAESIGASLLDIKGPSEYQFLSSSGITTQFWTGLSQEPTATEMDGDWSWIDGTPLDGGILENELVPSINLNDYFSESNLTFTVDSVYPRSDQSSPSDGDRLNASISGNILNVSLVAHAYGESSIILNITNPATSCTVQSAFKINVIGEPNAPTDIVLGGTQFAENTAGDFTLLAVDNDSKEHVFELLPTNAYPDNQHFSVASGKLTFSNFNYESPLDADGDNSYSLGIRTSDNQLDTAGANLTFDKVVVVTVTDANDLPVVQDVTEEVPSGSVATITVQGVDSLILLLQA